jgi:hypothetical protein
MCSHTRSIAVSTLVPNVEPRVGFPFRVTTATPRTTRIRRVRHDDDTTYE